MRHYSKGELLHCEACAADPARQRSREIAGYHQTSFVDQRSIPDDAKCARCGKTEAQRRGLERPSATRVMSSVLSDMFAEMAAWVNAPGTDSRPIDKYASLRIALARLKQEERG